MGLPALTIQWRMGSRLQKPVTFHLQHKRLTTERVILNAGPPPPWTEEDVKRLLVMKSENKPTADILAAFPGRTLAAIAVKWSKVAPRGQSGRPVSVAPEGKFFTEDERRKIQELRAAGLSYTRIQREHFPTRTPQGIAKGHIATWIEIPAQQRNSKWTIEDEQRLFDLRYNQKMDIRSAAIELGRSYSSVMDRLRKITPRGMSKGATQAIRSDSFSPEEDYKLLEMHQAGKSVSNLRTEFPKHPGRRVQNRLTYLLKRDPIYRRRPEEIREQISQKLRELATQGMSFKEMAAQFPDVPEKTLQTYFYKLDPEYKSAAAKRNLTADDDKVISSMAKDAATLTSIRSALNDRFSKWHIKKRMLDLGLWEDWRGSVNEQYRLFTPADDGVIIEMSKRGATREAIRSKLNDKFSLFQLRRRIKILEERENFKAKMPLHWQLKKKEDSVGEQVDFKDGYKLKPGTAEADEKTMSMAHSGKSVREILEMIHYSSVKAFRTRLRELGLKWNVNVDRRYRKPNPSFTLQDDDMIAEMYQTGSALADISTALKWRFSDRGVQARIKKLSRERGIKRQIKAPRGKQRRENGPAVITERDKNLVSLYKDDASDQEILRVLNIPTKGHLITWIKDLKARKGVKLPRRAANLAMTEEELRKRAKQREAERASRAKRRDSGKPYKPHATFNPVEDEKLTNLVREGAAYGTMIAAFDSKFTKYQLRKRRRQLGLPEETPRVKGARARGDRVNRPSWALSKDDKSRLMQMRDQAISWQEMAQQVPEVPVVVVQDYYFYGEQVMKLRADGTPRTRRSKSGTGNVTSLESGSEDEELDEEIQDNGEEEDDIEDDEYEKADEEEEEEVEDEEEEDDDDGDDDNLDD